MTNISTIGPKELINPKEEQQKHWELHLTSLLLCVYFGGVGVLFCMALAIRAAMQYWVSHAHLVASAQQSMVSSSRSQASATIDWRERGRGEAL